MDEIKRIQKIRAEEKRILKEKIAEEKIREEKRQKAEDERIKEWERKFDAEQKIKGKEDAIIHSATISQGNSGGPLINACGRVLGINTFISTSEVRTLNIALSVSGLRQFLSDAAIDFYETDETCNPRLIQTDPASDP